MYFTGNNVKIYTQFKLPVFFHVVTRKQEITDVQVPFMFQFFEIHEFSSLVMISWKVLFHHLELRSSCDPTNVDAAYYSLSHFRHSRNFHNSLVFTMNINLFQTRKQSTLFEFSLLR